MEDEGHLLAFFGDTDILTLEWLYVATVSVVLTLNDRDPGGTGTMLAYAVDSRSEGLWRYDGVAVCHT